MKERENQEETSETMRAEKEIELSEEITFKEFFKEGNNIYKKNCAV